MDISWIIELIIIIIAFIAYKHGMPLFKDIMMSRWAYIIVSAANEKQIVGELEDKWNFALNAMKAQLEKYHITFDEEEVTNYLKAAITKLRTEISGTNAELKKSKKSKEQA